MKKVLLILAGLILTICCVNYCNNSQQDDDDSATDDYTPLEGKVVEAEGNVITLESGHRVSLLGISPDNKWVENWLKANLVGKTVRIEEDSRVGVNHFDDEEDIPGYVIYEEGYPSANYELILSNPQVLDISANYDSLEYFKKAASFSIPVEKPEEVIEDLAFYMKQRSFLVQTPEGLGTGFFINSNGMALTNNHVLSDANGVVWLYDSDNPDNSELSEELRRGIEGVYYTDPQLDITIFQIQLGPGERVPYFKLADKHVPQGTRVATYGNPFGLTASYTSGDLSAYRGKVDGRPLVQYSMATNPGNSGGPVVEPHGLVIAVHDLGSKDMQNVNYGIDILAVREVLDRYNADYGGK